jgi:tetratricopeptide (TPR) repeat protein
LLGAILVGATVLAYLPAIRAGFIWDDPEYVLNNANLRTVAGLWDTWFVPKSLPQYYPLVHTTFWVEYHLWRLDPLGYHLVNVLLHASAALLLWMILRRLDVRGCYLAAFIFAMHPVMVESVAWITERKNVLSTVLYLASGYVYLFGTRFGLTENAPPRQATRRYWLALVLFLLALFSKTVTATLPAGILLVLWWKRGKLTRRDVLALLPFFVAGIALGALTGYLERTHVGAAGEQIVELRLSGAQRCLIAGRAIAFYSWKLIWPTKLTFIYPRWNSIDHPTLAQWLYPLAILIALAALFFLRKRIGRGPVTAALFFCGTLVPALGFVNIYPMRFSFVADHFQYLASIGMIVLLATLIARLELRARWTIGAVLLTVLGVLTFRQCGIYRDAETLWRATAERNPNSWLVWTNLANALVAQHPPRYDEAIPMYFKARDLAPQWYETRWNAGEALAMQNRVDDAEAEFREALRLNPKYPPAWTGIGKLMFFRRHNVEQAMECYRKALAINPSYSEANYYLALALEPRDPQQAVEHYRLAVGAKPQWYDARYNLGTCLMNLGQYDEAVANLREATQIDPGKAEAWTNLGAALLKLGRRGESAGAFQRALSIDPALQPARRGLDAALGRRPR